MFSIEQFQMLWELSKQLNPALHNQEVPIYASYVNLQNTRIVISY